MKNLFVFVFSLFVFSNYAQNLQNINPDPNGDPWIVGGFRELTEQEIEDIPEWSPEMSVYRNTLPSRVDNTQNKYFRSVVLQSGGSCSQASGIAYIYTYEVNRLRDLSSDDSVNQYPSHFTYNFLNKGNDENGSNYTDGWQILKVNGCPNLKEYGGLYPIGDKGWISGYDTYYRAMNNRVVSYYRLKVNTPEGLNTLKEYLVHHGEGSETGGIVNFSAGAASAKNRPLPLGGYEERRRIIIEWSDPVDHAMTFAGYDDSVRYDINNDKKFTNDIDITGDGIVDMRDWEIGAMIMVNTWSANWADSGRAYNLYRNLALKVSEGGISNGQVYIVIPEKEQVKPEMSLKLKLQHEKRNKLSIKIGIAEYVNDTVPDYEISLYQLNKRGGPYPMQGNNEDPIEMGFDISPLLYLEDLEMARVFISITEDDEDTSAAGQLISWSIMDYRNGIKEYSSDDSLLDIVNHGLTRSSIMMLSTAFPPENLAVNEESGTYHLTWNKPSDVSGLTDYVIFKDGYEYKFATDTFLEEVLVPNGTQYKVKARYNGLLSTPSNTVVVSNSLYLPVAGSGYALKYDGDNDCVNCGSGIDISNHDFTIEFWAKRNPDPSNQFVIGAGTWNKGHYGLHIGFRDNKLMCGFWGDDVHTDEVYTDSEWHHWTITYDTTSMMQTILRDGILAGERKADAHYRGTKNLYIGCMKGNTWYYQGELDEVRIWNYVRNEKQIRDYMFLPLAGKENGLLAYWKFDERSGFTLDDKSDSNNTGTLKNFSEKAWVNSEAWSRRLLQKQNDSILVFSGYSKSGNSIRCEIPQQPQYGKLVVDSVNSRILYIHETDFTGTDKFTYRIVDSSLTSLYFVEISADLLQSVLEIKSERIQVYPNPAKDKLFVNLNENTYSPIFISVFDLKGNLLFTDQKRAGANSRQFQIDMSDLAKGYYIVQLNYNSIEESFKIMKSE
ncbi:MAG: T9SS type A sorting domain-containing protein [Bacteroidetes bacterium]|nr:T9SS type A sorting domain-containing protein [Bacteroidota bacterium]